MIYDRFENFSRSTTLNIVCISLHCSHRHRHTEQEEDAELLEQSKHQKAIVHFEQSPSCK